MCVDKNWRNCSSVGTCAFSESCDGSLRPPWVSGTGGKPTCLESTKTSRLIGEQKHNTRGAVRTSWCEAHAARRQKTRLNQFDPVLHRHLLPARRSSPVASVQTGCQRRSVWNGFSSPVDPQLLLINPFVQRASINTRYSPGTPRRRRQEITLHVYDLLWKVSQWTLWDKVQHWAHVEGPFSDLD